MYAVTSSSADAHRKVHTDVRARVQLQGGNARLDYVVGGPMGVSGAHLIVKASPRQFAIVHAKDKQVTIMDAVQFGSGVDALMNDSTITLHVTRANLSFRDMGAGGEILGYRTRRVRFYNTSDMEVNVRGMTQRSSSTDSSDQWIVVVPDGDEASLTTWNKSFSIGMKTTNPELTAEFAKYQKAYGRQALALRSITWSNTIDGKGRVTSDVVAMVVTDLRTVDSNPKVFAIPDGYRVTNLAESGVGGGVRTKPTE